ncbi:MAG: oligosaccharide flippase family protein [Firmicutes bacterium]|nr:oligosaccharide flippase family protein [Bacillota bacterium]
MQSRVQNSIRNTLWNVIQFFIAIVLSFVTRTFFVIYLGDVYLGLNSLFLNIVTILGFFELGIGAAIVFSLYKPVAENNIEKINALVNLFKKVYLVISLIIIVVGIAALPLIPLLIRDELSFNSNVVVIYLLFLLQSAIGYIFQYRRILFLVYQRNDIITKIRLVQTIVLNVGKILVIVFIQSFLFVVVVTVAVTLVDNLVIYFLSKKYYRNITGKQDSPLEKSEKKWIKDYTAAMVLHKIGGIVVLGIDNILIVVLLSLVIAGHFSNYALLIAAANSLILTTIVAFRGSVGNLIAEKNPSQAYEIYKKLSFLQGLGVVFTTISFVVLFQPFIALWVGSARQLDLLSVTLLCTVFFITNMRQVNLMFIDCAGLMRKSMLNPVFEVPLKLVASLVLGFFLGLPGILLGTIISAIFTVFWLEPRILYKEYFKNNHVWHYFISVAGYAALTIALSTIILFILHFIPFGNFGWFALKMTLSFVITIIVFLLIFHRHKHFKYCLNLAVGVLRRKKKTTMIENNTTDTGLEKSNEVIELVKEEHI